MIDLKKYIELGYRIIFIIISGISVLIHFTWNDGDYNAHEFSFFTVQSNIFCFVVMFILLLKYYSGSDKYSKWLVYFKGMALSAIICTFFVYHFAESRNKYPLIDIGVFGLPPRDLLAHYLTPFMFILDWLIFQPKGYFKWRYILTWLAFPIMYFTTFVTRCCCNAPEAFINVAKYPYFFLDYETLGKRAFIQYILLLTVIMITENTLIISIDKFIYKIKNLKSFRFKN